MDREEEIGEVESEVRNGICDLDTIVSEMKYSFTCGDWGDCKRYIDSLRKKIGDVDGSLASLIELDGEKSYEECSQYEKDPRSISAEYSKVSKIEYSNIEEKNESDIVNNIDNIGGE